MTTQFIVTVKPAAGRQFRVLTAATSAEQAIRQVAAFESCPERICSAKEKTDKAA